MAFASAWDLSAQALKLWRILLSDRRSTRAIWVLTWSRNSSYIACNRLSKCGKNSIVLRKRTTTLHSIRLEKVKLWSERRWRHKRSTCRRISPDRRIQLIVSLPCSKTTSTTISSSRSKSLNSHQTRSAASLCDVVSHLPSSIGSRPTSLINNQQRASHPIKASITLGRIHHLCCSLRASKKWTGVGAPPRIDEKRYKGSIRYYQSCRLLA